jgi:hypothetical protein
LAKNFYTLYKTPNGIFQHLKEAVEKNPIIWSRKMFYGRCKKYPNEWAIIENKIGICKGCKDEFDINIKKSGYCSSKCRSVHKSYKINIKDYENLLKEQSNKCAICNTEFNEQSKKYKQINIDHDHNTLKVRGILCSPCNRALGLLKDNVEAIENMINYIKKHNNENTISKNKSRKKSI